MKKYLIVCLACVSLIGNAQEKWSVAQAAASQQKLNAEFSNPAQTPLDETI